MKVWISDSLNRVTTVLELKPTEPEFACLEGNLPDGLAFQDLSQLGTVSYVSGTRGRPIPKIHRVEPSENLEYVRALVEAMPPGFHVCRVESEKIEELRRKKALLFFQELKCMNDALEGESQTKT